MKWKALAKDYPAPQLQEQSKTLPATAKTQAGDLLSNRGKQHDTEQAATIIDHDKERRKRLQRMVRRSARNLNQIDRSRDRDSRDDIER